MTEPFTMSIEWAEGKRFVHGFHLGTHEDLARSIVRERFAGRIKAKMPTVTIALMREGKIVDVFYGDKWHNEMEDKV